MFRPKYLCSPQKWDAPLAFPFVYLAINMAKHGGITDAGTINTWIGSWFAYDFTYRVVMGIAVGAAIGWLLAHYAFRISDEMIREETREGLFVISAIFLSYGIAEAVHGYGFLAVFAASVSSRQNVEKFHDYYAKPYQFATQLERVFAGLLLIALGGFVATTNMALFSWQNLLFAVLFMLLVRPLSGRLALLGMGLSQLEANAIAFLGIRGFGSFYYLAYAQNNATFESIHLIWGIVTLTVLLSLLFHGNVATLAMEKIDYHQHHRKRVKRHL
ncbi:MAG: cation:proton antiporter [Phormidesmis sp.]